MWSMIVCILPSVEYLQSIIWICLWPRYVKSLTSLPTYSGIDWGYSGFSVLSSCRPSCKECGMPWRFVCEEVSKSAGRLLKYVMGFRLKSAHKMGHRPPLDFCRSWSSRRNVLLWRWVLSLAANLHPPRMYVFVSGDWHLVHMRDMLCFLLHL